MKDGLYRVNYRGICAGFVVEGGKVTRCAPILRKRLLTWGRYAKWVSDGTNCSTANDALLQVAVSPSSTRA